MAEARLRRGYVDHGAGQVHYRIAGEGQAGVPPLLMLHPTPKSGWIYEGLMLSLAAKGRVVVAPDTPGYGASDSLPGEADITDYADANFALIAALARDGVLPPGPVDVLGYHTGSVTSCAMALARPDGVRRVVLFSLPFYDAEQRAAKLQGLASWPRPVADGSHIQRMWQIVGGLCDKRVSPEWQHRSVVENLRAVDSPAGYRAVYRYDLAEHLPRLRQPVLLINAEDDLFEQTRRARPLLPGAEYRELPGAAHGMFDLDRERIARIVDAFLSQPG